MPEDGRPDPGLETALAAWATDPCAATEAQVLAALCGARVFVPVTATSTAEHVEPGTGLRAESSAEMAVLTIVGSGGGRALPAFLNAGGPVAFRPGARPVPLPGPQACAAALQDGAVAVLVDPSGAAFALTGPALAEVAAGRVPIVGTALSTRLAVAALTDPEPVDPALLRAVAAALREEPVRAARLLGGPDGPVLGVVPDAPLTPSALAALAARVLLRLADSLPAEGLDLAVVAEHGPGLRVDLSAARTGGRWRWFRPDR